MNIKDLFTGDNDKLSHTKLWSNIAYATMTFIVIFMAVKGTLVLDMFIAYGIIVAAHNSASKLIGAKFGKTSLTDENKAE